MIEKIVFSIIIRVRNAEKDLQRCLNHLRLQHLPKGAELEIVVVDNGSTDNSAQVAQEYGAKIVFLPVKEFSWGRALNRGIAAASGEIVLLLSADAYPADNNWIVEMVTPLKDPQIVAVYGRQIPRPDAPIDEIVRLRKTFGTSTIIAKELPLNFTPRGGVFPVSNACAAIRKKIWEEFPYDEGIEGGEEGVWTYTIFQKGYSVAYQAAASVYHSHNDRIFRSAWRSLELIKKNAALVNEKVTVYSYMRFMLSKTKKRLYNTFFSGISLSARIKGLFFLPVELIAFCISIVFFHINNDSSQLRSFFWDR